MFPECPEGDVLNEVGPEVEEPQHRQRVHHETGSRETELTTNQILPPESRDQTWQIIRSRGQIEIATNQILPLVSRDQT